MRLWELFEDITPAEVKQAERELDSAVYQPVTKMDKGYPVIDLELPVNDSHFMQRLIQRAEKANIDIDQIKNLLKSAKRDPKLGYSDDIDRLSTAERPHSELVLQDPNKLRIPVVVKPNPVCARTQPGSSVCLTRSGQRAPRNTMVAKTVMRKGVPD